MSPTVWKSITTLLPVAWLGVFGAELVGAHRAHQAALRSLELADRLALDQTRDANRIVTFTNEFRSHNREVEFLQGLVDVLPQEKSFVRTQRAMADDVETLRAKVGRRLKNDLHVLVDTKANKLYVKRGLTLLWAADCSVGRGGILIDKKSGRRWEFATPRGVFDIRGRVEKPAWTKPDWAFVESGEPVPPPNDPKRRVEGELGAYVFDLGDGYLIHGTKSPELLGRPVSHGCVRLGVDDLQKLFDTVPRGTRVYIY